MRWSVPRSYHRDHRDGCEAATVRDSRLVIADSKPSHHLGYGLGARYADSQNHSPHTGDVLIVAPAGRLTW